MSITIISSHSAIAYPVASAIEQAGFGPVAVDSRAAEDFRLRHASDVSPTRIMALTEAITPLTPPAGADDTLASDHIVITLGAQDGFDAWNIAVATDDQRFGCNVLATLNRFGFEKVATRPSEFAVADRMVFGGASRFVRQSLRFILQTQGIDAAETKAFSDNDRDIRLVLQSPKARQLPLQQRVPIRICTDEPAAAVKVQSALSAQGFANAEIRMLDEDDVLEKQFSVSAKLLQDAQLFREIGLLFIIVGDAIVSEGIDVDVFPLVADTSGIDQAVEITLPLRACRNGLIRKYGGAVPERFEVTLYTDAPARGQIVVNRFRELGFEVESIRAMDMDDIRAGFRIKWGAAKLCPEITRTVSRVLDQWMAEAGPDASEQIFDVSDGFSLSDTDIWIYAPLDALQSGRLIEMRSDPSKFKLILKSPSRTVQAELNETFKDWGFRSVRRSDDSDPVSTGLIRFGGAPNELIERIVDTVTVRYGWSLQPEKAWPDHDKDIEMVVPKDAMTTAPDARPNAEDSAPSTSAAASKPELARETPIVARSRPFLLVDSQTVLIGDVALPRRPGPGHPFVPDASRFSHYCVDRTTAATLSYIAEALALNEPCCLEGPTSNSKTSAILYLASLLNRPAIRLNLNGQTDTGELIGRYVPDADEGQGWRWSPGGVIQAMTEGFILILDELNLAEPQVLERLNSVLEAPPSLVVSEHDNSVLGGAAQPVHPDFQIFATMNPVDDYVGRTVLSPAYRDRWRAFRHVDPPGEQEYAEMLRFLVSGQHPPITLDGILYEGLNGEAEFPELAGVPNLEQAMAALARFQVSVEHAAGTHGGAASSLGQRKREKYVFTRRGLLNVVRYVAERVNCGGDLESLLSQALARYYTARLATEEDHNAVCDLAEAAGLPRPQAWRREAG